MDISSKVYNYPTKNKMGFLLEEIEQLLSEFPNVNKDKFDNSLRGVTCVADENMNMIIYHCDIHKALICGLENRDFKGFEWD